MNRKSTRNAHRTRSQIARTFKRVERHELDLSELLEQTPRCLKRVRVYDVVRRLPHMGGDGADKCLRKARVWPLTRMGALTDDERERIIAHLPPRAKGIV